MLPHHLSLLPFPITLVLLLLSPLSPDAVAQNTVADCGPSLLPLAPCGPFVQGRAPAPVRTCCDNVDVLYKHNLTCLCVLLDNSSLESPIPINTTLALQLPLLCKLKIDPSTCPGSSLPSLSPPTQVSLGAKGKPKSIATGGISASPVITSPTRPRFTGFRVHQNAEVRLEAGTSLLMLLMAAIFLQS
ncbi:hypothetical protein C2S53_003384 [Perilla frutescens var. hirtella]|uniref:Bifunctional inhibitor/plant lipid transfer protein/seed storage helical domain-containing protein n=1 Tax=Perilla frutescens var. hirtella TaxID=608512 RepID=A0AAD4NZ99_PERFH|nr:hypothetical protein C2S53_003384 [Perilla frutescens var. hirtella]